MTFAQVNRLRSLDDILREDAADGSTIGFVRRKTVTLTDAQIKALPTTAVQLIAAPGANKAIVPLVAFAALTLLADYTNVAVAAFATLSYKELTGTRCSLPIRLGNGNYLDPGSVGAFSAIFGCPIFSTPDAVAVDGVSTPVSAVTGFDIATHLANVGVVLAVDNNAGGNFTGGNAGNSMTVTVYYVVVDV